MDLRVIEKRLIGLLEERLDTESLREFTPSHDEGDSAAVVYEKETTANRLECDRIRRIQVRVALDRIKSGDFGICLACDSDISAKRIKAVPWTPFCAPCQNKLDCYELVGFECYQAPRLTRGNGRFH